MNRFYCVAVLLAAVLTCPPAMASATKPMPQLRTGAGPIKQPADPGRFTFVVAGDNRSTGYGYPMPDAFTAICRQIGLLQPNLVVWTGDCIEGYGDSPRDADLEYTTFLSGLSLTNAPVFNAPGNHEFSLDARLLPVYTTRMAPLFGSFDYGNSHFVILNTNAVEPDGAIQAGSLDEAQWAWLESDLKANQSAANIFVFMHHYPFGPPDPDTPAVGDTGWSSIAGRDRLHAMMLKYGVRAVFASHDHIYYHTVKDGVDYYISGGAGAPLDASPDQGGFLHYLAVDVAGSKIGVRILQPWRLDVAYPEGNAPSSVRGHAWVTNTQGADVVVNHLLFHLAALHPGRKYTVAALVAYKVKHKPTTSSILSITPVAGGKSADVVVSVACPKSRTTDVVVTAD